MYVNIQIFLHWTNYLTLGGAVFGRPSSYLAWPYLPFRGFWQLAWPPWPSFGPLADLSWSLEATCTEAHASCDKPGTAWGVAAQATWTLFLRHHLGQPPLLSFCCRLSSIQQRQLRLLGRGVVWSLGPAASKDCLHQCSHSTGWPPPRIQFLYWDDGRHGPASPCQSDATRWVLVSSYHLPLPRWPCHSICPTEASSNYIQPSPTCPGPKLDNNVENVETPKPNLPHALPRGVFRLSGSRTPFAVTSGGGVVLPLVWGPWFRNLCGCRILYVYINLNIYINMYIIYIKDIPNNTYQFSIWMIM